MKALRLAAALAAAFSTAPSLAQSTKPSLIVAISVDQFSADLFDRYRPHFTGGLKRLADGVAFSNGYQAHGMTETCPGHATILTGSHPARTGVVANDWYDRNAAREDREIYCAEDERVPGSTSHSYTVSPYHLKVPTLGDRMKKSDPESRVVAVAGKDRSAVMMSGQAPDQRWYWQKNRFVSDLDSLPAPIVEQVNASVARAIAEARPDLTPPAYCAGKAQALEVGGRTIGLRQFRRKAGNTESFQMSPELDAATLTMAAALFQQMQLGRGGHADLLTIALSAADYVGHYYGTDGIEMCLQMASLDADLGAFFSLLDRSGIDYAVVLTADHGGLDTPERQRAQGVSDAQRVSVDATPKGISGEIARHLGLAEPVLEGNWYVSAGVPANRRTEIVALAKQLLAAQPQVAAVHTAKEVGAHPIPAARPEDWTTLDKMRASFDPARSGDLIVAYKRNVTPIANPGPTTAIADHGSIWDYDRKVPILFWRKGIAADNRAESAMTVDILPTLASLIGLEVPQGEIDGRCLDIVAGEGTNCR